MKSSPPFWSRLGQGRHVRRIGSGSPAFTALVLRGRLGPVAVINGGTHGDEYEGPTVLQELAAQIRPDRLQGTLVIIPVLHEAAFFAGTRCHPEDGSNLARVFPGNPRGNHAERVAALFLERVLRHADYYLDLHSGGTAYDLLPWSGYMLTGRAEIDAIQHRMARCFDDYWCWGSHYAPGRTLSAAAAAQVPAIYTESRGAGGVHPADRAALHRGLRHFLVAFGFVRGPTPRLKKPPVRIARHKEEAHLQLHHPAPADGLFIPAVTVGAVLARRSIIGRLHPLGPAPAVTIRAGHRGTLVCLRRQRSVRKGEALATVVALPRR